MHHKKIVLAGGNGYLGGVLANYYKDKADEIVILSRKPMPQQHNIKTVVWDGHHGGDWITELEGADLLINLCGKNVNCRYTPQNRKDIIASRVNPTNALGAAIGTLNNPPQLWINVTSATIYRHAEDHPQDEETGEIGYGFSIDVCKIWEETFFRSTTPNTRKIALRMGIVLGRKDGVFPRLLNLVRAGLGGKQGNGQQYISWIHEHDVAKCTEWLFEQQDIDGVINCTAPRAIKNYELMGRLRSTYGAAFSLPMPVWLLDLGARLIGTETELILKSRWVTPKRLIDSGYTFAFEKVQYAIDDILSIRI
jgi:uncharacterized protein (TIGR01777 family)